MSKKLLVYIRRAITRRKGQSMVEYGFLIGLIALGVMLALRSLGQVVANFFSQVTF